VRRQAPKAEIGLVLYPGCQQAMVLGMTDLLLTAGEISVGRGGLPVRLSHWRPDGSGEFARGYDSHPGDDCHPDILVAPGRLTGPVDREEAASFAAWLGRRHARGSVLALDVLTPASRS
jgi:transcriptional regulator GlxA family with amidase domain